MRFFRDRFDAVPNFAYKGSPLSIAVFASPVITIEMSEFLLAV